MSIDEGVWERAAKIYAAERDDALAATARLADLAKQLQKALEVVHAYVPNMEPAGAKLTVESVVWHALNAAKVVLAGPAALQGDTET